MFDRKIFNGGVDGVADNDSQPVKIAETSAFRPLSERAQLARLAMLRICRAPTSENWLRVSSGQCWVVCGITVTMLDCTP